MTDTAMTLRFSLPWPPSINSMYQQGIIGGKHTKARASMFLSDRGKAYRREAWVALVSQHVPVRSLHGRLKVEAIAMPPDQRVRDLDNLWKSALDALKHHEVILDDGYIDDLHIRRGARVTGGRLEVVVSELGEFNEQRDLLPLIRTLDAPPPPF